MGMIHLALVIRRKKDNESNRSSRQKSFCYNIQCADGVITHVCKTNTSLHIQNFWKDCVKCG